MSGHLLDERCGRLGRRVVLAIAGGLVLTILVFFVRRIVIDSANLGGNPAYVDPPDRAYLHHPWLAYLHMVPGVVYLLGAPFQLSRRFRTKHYGVHRRMGRVVLACGLISGVFVLVFGASNALGGVAETVSAVMFGGYFIICLVTAYLAIRRGHPVTHRRWMIRAFAVGTSVGMMRVWIGILYGLIGTTIQDSFAIAFWIGPVVHIAVGELWLRRAPQVTA